MRGVNKVILVGTLGKDPETKTFPNGGSLTCLMAGWPLWIVLAWMMVMISGMFFRPPFDLIWKVLTLGFSKKAKLKSEISGIMKEVTALVENVK